ncbi:MAG: hypothetical protein LCI02_18305 [Proteobacteria bacterium]|nr:hypothetical protein [Pseudomonadota bacterium]
MFELPFRPGRPLAALPALVSVLLLTLAPPAQAQAQPYGCNSGGRNNVYGNRPCPADGSTRLGGYGPVEEAPPVRRSATPAPAARAPDYLSYMSSECASLNDGLRTAGQRGLAMSTQAELRDDYNRRCSANESQARQRWSQEQMRGKQGQREEQHQTRLEAQRDQAQQQQFMAQCVEMRRIIAAKNERLATLTPGEVSDLRRFEANYAARCVTRTQ